MANTTIEWTNKTWNPTRGCSRVSEGCRFCYAERQAARNLPGLNSPTTGKPFAIMTDSGPRWTGKVELIESKLYEPLHWRKPQRIFVNSMSDLWHEALATEDQADIYGIMAMAHWHDFQVLTKRPQNRLAQFSDPTFAREVESRARDYISKTEGVASWRFEWPLPNVWEGVSIEDQPTADERIPLLLQTSAAIRFVSYEPALGPVNFGRYVPADDGDGHCTKCGMKLPDKQESLDLLRVGMTCDCPPGFGPSLNWIIAGGESAHGARPANPDWFKSVRHQCQSADVPFFFKQWGEWSPTIETEPDNDRYHEWPSGGFSARLGKKAAGAMLDGREWREFPKALPDSGKCRN